MHSPGNPYCFHLDGLGPHGRAHPAGPPARRDLRCGGDRALPFCPVGARCANRSPSRRAPRPSRSCRVDQDARERMQAAFGAQRRPRRNMHWSDPEPDSPGHSRNALACRPDDPRPARLRRPGGTASFLGLPARHAGGVAAGRRSCCLCRPARHHRPQRCWWRGRTHANRRGPWTAALPWLCTTAHVHAVAYGRDADASLGRRGGIPAGATRRADETLHGGGADEDDVGNRLLSLAADVGADLAGHGLLRPQPGARVGVGRRHALDPRCHDRTGADVALSVGRVAVRAAAAGAPAMRPVRRSSSASLACSSG